MGRRRPELTRNKRGTPVYSKEDIREQYCINEKEVHVLERINARSIFNCFSDRNPSPCKRQTGSLLTSCYKKRRRSGRPEEEEAATARAPLPRPRTHWRTADDDADVEFFRRTRPRVFCYTDPKRFTWTEGDLNRGGGRSGRPRSPPAAGAGAGSAAGRPPSQLATRDASAHNHSWRPNGTGNGDRVSFTQPNTPDLASARWRHASQEDKLDERQQQKHVSFDAHIFRSQTMSSIDGEAYGTAQQPVSSAGSSRALNRSQERLLDGRRTPDYVSDNSSAFGSFLTRALLQEKMKRASMRTQSTQTEMNALAEESAPPSYLSLSPRTVHRRMRSQGMQTTRSRGSAHRALTKSYSEVGQRPSQIRRRSPPDEPVMSRTVSSPVDINPPTASSAENSAVSGLSNASVRGSEMEDKVSDAETLIGGDRTSLPSSEQEIMINYQPYNADLRQPLQKTRSEGQILLDKKERARLKAVCVEAHGDSVVVDQMTVSESDLLEPNSGRLRSLAQATRAEVELETPENDIPPPPPPRDYDDDEFHENLIENLLCEAVPRAESPSSCSETSTCEQAAVTRDALSPPRSNLTRDSLTESQETVLAAVGSGAEDGSAPQPPLPLPSDSDAGTPCAGPDTDEMNTPDIRPEIITGSDSGSLGSNPPELDGAQRVDFENGAPSSTSGSSLAREEGLVLRQLDAISTELDNRLASPEDLSRMSPPPPTLEGWKDSSPAPSYVSSVSEGDEEKRIEKFMRTLNEGFESDTSDVRKSASPCAPFSSLPRTLNGKSAQTVTSISKARRKVSPKPQTPEIAHSRQTQGTGRPPSTGSIHSDRSSDMIQPPSRVESLSSVSSTLVGSRRETSHSTATDFSDASVRSDTTSSRHRSSEHLRKRDGKETVKRYSRYFEENEEGQLVEVDKPRKITSSPSPDRSQESSHAAKPRRQLSKQYSMDVPQVLKGGMRLDLAAGSPKYQTADQVAVEQRLQEVLSAETSGSTERKHSIKGSRKSVRLDLEGEVGGENEQAKRSSKIKRGDIGTAESTSVSVVPDVISDNRRTLSLSLDESKSRAKSSSEDDVIGPAKIENKTSNGAAIPVQGDSTELEKRWSKKGSGVSSGMVRSPAMHQGFRPEDWCPVRTPQTPDKIIVVSEALGSDQRKDTEATKKHKEKKKKKRSKERHADDSREKSSSHSRERGEKEKEKSEKRSSKSPSKRRSTVPEPYLTVQTDQLVQNDDTIANKATASSLDIRVDAIDNSLLSAKPSAESLRSVSQGSDNVFVASSPEGVANADAPMSAVTEQRQTRLDALSSEPSECVQCSSCGERMRSASRERSLVPEETVVALTSAAAVPKQTNAQQISTATAPAPGADSTAQRKLSKRQDSAGDRVKATAKGAVVKERHKSAEAVREKRSDLDRKESKRSKRHSTGASPVRALDRNPSKETQPAPSRQSPPHGLDQKTVITVTKESSTDSAVTPTALERQESASKKRSSKSSEATTGSLREDGGSSRRQPSRGSSRRRRGEKERVMSEERVLEEKPAVESRAKSEERYSQEPTSSSHHSQDSLASRPTDASTQSLISMRDLHEEEAGVYQGHFPAARWLYIGIDEEMRVWRKRPRQESPTGVVSRAASPESTESERDFRKRYQAISHRMVHRKSSGHMFQQLEDKNFASDKSVLMQKCSGEFGFRIHGSRPVVVSAIEPGTPAEISGLEVGDIIISINGTRVLESSHGEVVKIAHAGSDELQLEVATTSSVLPLPERWSRVREGALWRRSDSSGSWCLRWAVLKSDGSLYLFKRAEDVHPVCGLSLTEASVTPTADCGREMAFVVQYDGASEPATLAADTQEDYGGWLEALKTVVHESSAERDWQTAVRLHAARAPHDIPQPDCCGFLSRLGVKWRCWKRTYCVLKDGILYFYQEPTDSVAAGAAYLHGYRVQSSGVGGRRPSFEVCPPVPRLRHFYFIADTENDRKRWLSALEYSVDRWIKVPR